MAATVGLGVTIFSKEEKIMVDTKQKSVARKLLSSALLVVSLLVVATGCSKSGSETSRSDDKTLYLYNWTYYTPESVIEKFEQEVGVKVVLD